MQSDLQLRIQRLTQEGNWWGFYFERLLTFPEGEWFAPTNGGRYDDATICRDIATRTHLIMTRHVPLWRNGNFCGVRTYYQYRHDLRYDDKTDQ